MKLVSVVIPIQKQGLTWQVWVQQRKEDGPLNGFYEFPGGKIEAGESPEDACVREIFEEVEVQIDQNRLQKFQITEHKYSDRHVCLFFYLYEVRVSENWKNGQWREVSKLGDDLLEANRPIARNLLEYLEREPNLGEWT